MKRNKKKVKPGYKKKFQRDLEHLKRQERKNTVRNKIVKPEKINKGLVTTMLLGSHVSMNGKNVGRFS